MSNVKSLINAISTGNALETENAFNATMAEKISARLETMRTDVAQNMFKTPEAVVEEELTQEEYDSILSEGELGKAVKAHADASLYHDQFGGNKAEVKATREKMHALAKERGIKPSRATKVANKMINRVYGEEVSIDDQGLSEEEIAEAKKKKMEKC
jgi:thymidine phosphorylase